MALVSHLCAAQSCSLSLQDEAGHLLATETSFYTGDTVRLFLQMKGHNCPSCHPFCLNCNTLNYTINDDEFSWIPDRGKDNSIMTLKFGLTCASADSVVSIDIKRINFTYDLHYNFDQSTPPYLRSRLSDFFSKKSVRVSQVNVLEGDSVYFNLFTPRNSPGRLSVIQSFRSFDGIFYADSKSVTVRWIPSYQDYKRDVTHELRVSLSNEEISNDPSQIIKSIKFKIVLKKDRPPLIDRTRSSTIDLDLSGDTYINLSSYFIPMYDKRDDELQFDFMPTDLACLKVNTANKNELIIRKSLYLNTQPRPKEILVRAKHSNSPYTEYVRLRLKSNFEPLGMALENKKFTFYDDDKIDEFIKIASNESYHLQKDKIEISGDTDVYDLKKIIKFDDQDQYLHLYTTKKVEIDDAETDDIQFMINLNFLNDLNKESQQIINITIHPRVNGDIARGYFKRQVDSLKVLLDSVKIRGAGIAKIRDKKGNKIDWYSKGASFVAIIIGSYGTAKNSANYGYSILAGLGMGALFLDIKQIKFFATKKYQKAKQATDDLERLQSDMEKHLITDTDKMGISFFEANYRQSDEREHEDFKSRYAQILRSFWAK